MWETSSLVALRWRSPAENNTRPRAQWSAELKRLTAKNWEDARIINSNEKCTRVEREKENSGSRMQVGKPPADRAGRCWSAGRALEGDAMFLYGLTRRCCSLAFRASLRVSAAGARSRGWRHAKPSARLSNVEELTRPPLAAIGRVLIFSCKAKYKSCLSHDNTDRRRWWW